MEPQAYYPTYKLKDTQIAIAEYEACSRSVESGRTMFVSATNVMLAVMPAMTGLMIWVLRNPPEPLVDGASGLLPLLIIFGACAFSLLAARYFAAAQKSVMVDSRKMVVLRGMLGLDFGTQQLVLPKTSLAGAGHPFDIKAFPGWFSYTALPFWLVWLATFMVLVLAVPYVVEQFTWDWDSLLRRLSIHASPTIVLSVAVVVVWTLVLAWCFRMGLLDYHETPLLLLTRVVARFLGVRLVDDMEYRIYRAKLAVYEAQRIEIPLDSMLPILMFLEDKRFLRHRGIDYRAIARALWNRLLRKGRKSGGSTITQQLARTLFIESPKGGIRRKCVELLLAKWLETVANKRDIAQMYLCSVRYANRVIGIAEAVRHFFGKMRFRELRRAHVFFLVERVSNMRSRVMTDRVKYLLDKAVSKRILSERERIDVMEIYLAMARSRRLQFDNESAVCQWEAIARQALSGTREAAMSGDGQEGYRLAPGRPVPTLGSDATRHQ